MTPTLRSYLDGLDHARRACVSLQRARRDKAYHDGATALERARTHRRPRATWDPDDDGRDIG